MPDRQVIPRGTGAIFWPVVFVLGWIILLAATALVLAVALR